MNYDVFMGGIIPPIFHALHIIIMNNSQQQVVYESNVLMGSQ